MATTSFSPPLPRRIFPLNSGTLLSTLSLAFIRRGFSLLTSHFPTIPRFISQATESASIAGATSRPVSLTEISMNLLPRTALLRKLPLRRRNSFPPTKFLSMSSMAPCTSPGSVWRAIIVNAPRLRSCHFQSEWISPGASDPKSVIPDGVLGVRYSFPSHGFCAMNPSSTSHLKISPLVCASQIPGAVLAVRVQRIFLQSQMRCCSPTILARWR